MKSLFHFSFYLLFTPYFFLTECSSSDKVGTTSAKDSVVFRKYSPNELREDLIYLMSTMEEIHPDLYIHSSKEKIYKEIGKIEKQLSSPLTRLEFFKIINCLTAQLNDGHTGISYPAEEIDFFNKSGGKYFPFGLSITSDGGIILHNYSTDSTIAEGSLIKAINGIPFNAIKDSLIKHIGFEREAKRIHVLENTFYRWLYIVYGLQNNFLIEYVLPGSSVICSKRVGGISEEYLKINRTKRLSGGSKEIFYFKALPDEKIALISFKNTADRDKFNDFLQETFLKVRNDSINDLIIDIRANGGGSSALSEDLLDYITDKPYKSFAYASIKTKAIKKKYPWYIRVGISLGLRSLLFDSTTSDGCNISKSSYIHPGKNALRYRGNIYLLAGSATFSAGTGLAAAIKDCRIGEVIGQETGGLASGSGDYIGFELPNTLIKAFVSTTYFIRPAGYDDGKGVVPDYEVIPLIEDKLKGIDTELEFTKKLIMKKRIHN